MWNFAKNRNTSYVQHLNYCTNFHLPMFTHGYNNKSTLTWPVRLFFFSLTEEIHQKSNLQNQEIKNKVIFHIFQLPEVRNSNNNNNNNNHCQISAFGFHCVAKNIEGWIEICTSYLIYSQIWLNLPHDHHIFYTFLSRGSPFWLHKKIPFKIKATLVPIDGGDHVIASR